MLQREAVEGREAKSDAARGIGPGDAGDSRNLTGGFGEIEAQFHLAIDFNGSGKLKGRADLTDVEDLIQVQHVSGSAAKSGVGRRVNFLADTATAVQGRGPRDMGGSRHGEPDSGRVLHITLTLAKRKGEEQV